MRKRKPLNQELVLYSRYKPFSQSNQRRKRKKKQNSNIKNKSRDITTSSTDIKDNK